MIVFSCCLYGNDERYIKPLFMNNLQYISQYLERECKFIIYCNMDVPIIVREKLSKHGYTIKVIDFDFLLIGNMFVRYLPILEEGNSDNVVLVRDCDCIYTELELDLIKLWLMTDHEFHIIRGHPLHVYSIMGGLFSIRGRLLKDFKHHFLSNLNLTKSSVYNADQVFLSKIIYPAIYKEALVHSTSVVYSEENYEIFNSELGFIGETIFSDEKRNIEKEMNKMNVGKKVFNQIWTKFLHIKGIAKIVTLLALNKRFLWK